MRGTEDPRGPPQWKGLRALLRRLRTVPVPVLQGASLFRRRRGADGGGRPQVPLPRSAGVQGYGHREHEVRRRPPASGTVPPALPAPGGKAGGDGVVRRGVDPRGGGGGGAARLLQGKGGQRVSEASAGSAAPRAVRIRGGDVPSGGMGGRPENPRHRFGRPEASPR